jgi:branched-chain amino acid transport system permease protein
LAYLYPGIVIGALYALLGGSISLTYSLTGVINLAVGATAYATAYLYYYLVTMHHWALAPAAVVCLVSAPAFGFIIWAAVFRNIENKDLIVQLTASIGIAVALPALMEFALPLQNVYQAPGIVPHGFSVLRLGFFNSNRDQLAAVIGAVICLGGLILAVEKSPLGLSTRAVVDKPQLAAGVGINTTRLSATSWILSSLLTGAAGILLSPLVQLDPVQYTSLSVAAVSVALVGRFRSLTVTSLAGLGLGVVASLITGYGPVGSVIVNGLVPALPFFLLAALLIIGRTSLGGRRDAGVDPARRPGSVASGGPWPDRSPALRVLRSVRYPAVLLVGAGFTLVAMFAFNAYWTGALAAGIAFSVVFLGFTVSTGEGGVLCLGQAGFAATGAIVAGRLATDAGLPLALSILIGVLCAAVSGVVIGVVGTRLDQVGFALVTLAFALFCQQFAFNLQALIPLAGVNYPVVTFGGLSPTRSDILLGAVTFAVLALLLSWFRRGRFGRVCAAIRGNPVEAESIGIGVKRVRVGVFALGSAVAGLGGALIGIEQGNIGTVDFALLTGLVWLAVVVTVGVRGFTGALVAGLLFSIAPAAFQFVHIRGFGNLPTVLFGLGAVGIARDPRGFISQAGSALQRVLVRPEAEVPELPPDAPSVPEAFALPLTGKRHE